MSSKMTATCFDCNVLHSTLPSCAAVSFMWLGVSSCTQRDVLSPGEKNTYWFQNRLISIKFLALPPCTASLTTTLTTVLWTCCLPVDNPLSLSLSLSLSLCSLFNFHLCFLLVCPYRCSVVTTFSTYYVQIPSASFSEVSRRITHLCCAHVTSDLPRTFLSSALFLFVCNVLW